MTHLTDRIPADSPRAMPVAREVDAAVVAWVIKSCERQGLPVKVTDAAVVARIGALLGVSDPAHGPESARSRPEGDEDVAA